MSWDVLKGNWKEVRGKVKEQWGKLTDDDLDVIDGKRDQLAGKLQRYYGYGKAEAESKIDDFLAGSSRHKGPKDRPARHM